MATAQNGDYMIRTDIWGAQVKDQFQYEYSGLRHFRDITSMIPDGDTLHIPSIGLLQAQDYNMGDTVSYQDIATGDWEFRLTEYKQVGTRIFEKQRQDIHYAAQFEALIPSRVNQALMANLEAHAFATSERGLPANSTVTINGYRHRFAASGGTAMTGELSLRDFIAADLALTAASIYPKRRIAIIDPVAAANLTGKIAITAMTNGFFADFEGLAKESAASSPLRPIGIIAGFEVYTSASLPTVTDNALPVATGSGTVDFSTNPGKAAFFFDAGYGPEFLPWVIGYRQLPDLEYIWSPETQEHKWISLMRFGTGLYRPENLVTIVTSSGFDISALPA